MERNKWGQNNFKTISSGPISALAFTATVVTPFASHVEAGEAGEGGSHSEILAFNHEMIYFIDINRIV